MKTKTTASFALLGSFILVTATIVTGHTDDPKMFEKVVVHEGKIWRHGDPQPEGAGYPSEGIELLAQIPNNQLPGSQGGANSDCWGYTSPSGREYAIMGVDCATVFVEITDPGNPIIVDHVAGPCCIWRDFKTYGEHAYIVSECGGLGIIPVDLSDIDNGNITVLPNVVGPAGGASHNVALNADTGYLYRTGGSHYGLGIYDLSNPAVPQYVNEWTERYCHDALVVTMQSGPWAGREIAFCCGGFNGGGTETGLDIVDVTDKQNLELLGRWVDPVGSYAHQGWLSDDQQYFFLGDELDEGQQAVPTTTKIIDISDLANPVSAGNFTNGLAATDHNLIQTGGLIFEGNYKSGLRVYDATNPLAPHEVAYFDTYPEDDNVGYSGLWAPYPLFPSGTIIGADRGRGLFIWKMVVLGDLNGDDLVDVADLLILLSQWGPCGDGPPCDADLNEDGRIDVADLLIMLAEWS